MPKYKAVVFVNGCFWHGHEGCKWFVPPKTNTEFWNKKFLYNQERDKLNYKKLRDAGWNVIIVWECEIRYGDEPKRLEALLIKITENRNI